MYYEQHTVEPSLSSIIENINDEAVDGEFIGMKRGQCATCWRSIDYDDDNAWHVEYDQ